MPDTMKRRLTAASLASVLALSLTACGSGSNDGNDSDAATTTGQDTGQSSDALAFSDGYVGAKDTETSMTAVFGELTNSTDEDIHLTRVT
ncbi:MAG: copper chaperone PCu(A)C, partial [Corynebacterium glyciniphilum]|nr:copper chaperone PCu(A)C [Corynebacterium glyciniphilum]